jgi:hypothetical protein
MKNTNIKKYSKSKKFFCCVTDEEINPERVEYLLSEGVPENRLTSLKGAEITHRPRKIIVVDDEGTHFFCDRIDNTRAWAQERFGDGSPEDTNYLDDIEEKKSQKNEESQTIDSVDILIKNNASSKEDEDEEE